MKKTNLYLENLTYFAILYGIITIIFKIHRHLSMKRGRGEKTQPEFTPRRKIVELEDTEPIVLDDYTVKTLRGSTALHVLRGYNEVSPFR